MKIYYWKEKKNFGDLLSSLLIQKFCHLDSEWSKPQDSDLVMVGSILEHLPSSYKGIVAGSGKLHDTNSMLLSFANILAVRGPLTAKALRLKKDVVLGDPGLLADELVEDKDKEFDLGIVAHWTDKTLEQNPIFKKFNPKIIRVDDDPLKVISEIGRCKKIVSSSLHGIILADAFGIPRRIEIPPRSLTHPQQEGGLFKWKDYSASIEMKLEIGVTQLADRNIIMDKKNELYDVFQQIKSIFK